MSKVVDEMGMTSNGTYAKAKGGTEMMADRIQSALEESGHEDKINIIHSRVRNVDPDKKNVYIIHDTWRDPECGHLKIAEDRKRFDDIIFVSNQQLQSFHLGLNVPYGEALVMKNAIDPVPWEDIANKPTDTINLIYHTTPHRGLELLVPAFEHLAEIHPNIHLDVFSSFQIYGWDQRDVPYQDLFNRIRNHPKATYHGYQPNSVVKEALNKAHIFAYPNIWPETSCIAALEAISAGCEVVCPNFEALPETTGGFATDYQYNEDQQKHLNMFATVLNHAIANHHSEHTQTRIRTAKTVIDAQYSWEYRKLQWIQYFNSVVAE